MIGLEKAWGQQPLLPTTLQVPSSTPAHPEAEPGPDPAEMCHTLVPLSPFSHQF